LISSSLKSLIASVCAGGGCADHRMVSPGSFDRQNPGN
jgi:hypothetical protein